jgi:hypothetical protein
LWRELRDGERPLKTHARIGHAEANTDICRVRRLSLQPLPRGVGFLTECVIHLETQESVMSEITNDEARPLTEVELDAVTGGLANAWLDWMADYFYLVKMEAHPTALGC